MKLFEQLVDEIKNLVCLYGDLRQCVQNEKEALLNTDVNQLTESNYRKEKLLIDIKSREKNWTALAQEISDLFEISTSIPSLKEIALRFSADKQSQLLTLHGELSTLVRDIMEINRKNQEVAQSALSHVNGAIESITKTVENSPTYEKKGRTKEPSSGGAGRLLAKQV